MEQITKLFKTITQWAVATFGAFCVCVLIYTIIFYAVHNAVHCEAHNHWEAEETEYTTF
jgi:hypothetical protein